MRRLLVTGGAGFIGTNFVHYWFEKHPESELTVLDALTYAGDRHNLRSVETNPGFEFVHGDICDEQLVVRLFRERNIDTVVHFAAESHVDRSIDGPEAFIRTNILGTHTLLKVAKAEWLERRGGGDGYRFHHVSTDEVYGSLGEGDPPFTEATPYAPNSPYSASKAASDHLVRAYGATYGLPYTISNCSNNYGPWQLPEKLIPVVIQRALRGDSIPVYGDGRNVRDWIYVEDHCAAVARILTDGQTGRTYNVGAGRELHNIDLVRRICAELDILRPREKAPYSELIHFVRDRPGHDRRYAIDSTCIRRDLGWEPATSFEDGLRRTINWYLNNQVWCADHDASGHRQGLWATMSQGVKQS